MSTEARGRPASKRQLADFWIENYLHPVHGLCVLCGNTGVVDTTTTATSSSGVRVGGRYRCVCPNGRAGRAVQP
jgi:hypothetical protein